MRENESDDSRINTLLPSVVLARVAVALVASYWPVRWAARQPVVEGLREEERPGWSPCSRSSHDETVVVQRAQWRTKPGRPSGEGLRASLEGLLTRVCLRNARLQKAYVRV